MKDNSINAPVCIALALIVLTLMIPHDVFADWIPTNIIMDLSDFSAMPMAMTLYVAHILITRR